MNTHEEMIAYLEKYSHAVRTSTDDFRCPRCGRTVHHQSENIYLCDVCYSDREEVFKELDSENIAHWWTFKTLQQISLPMHPQLVARELEVDRSPYSISAAFECWFDVEKKFDIRLDCNDAWINFYAQYNVLLKKLKCFYIINSDTSSETFLYVPTDIEENRILNSMETACLKETHYKMAEFVKNSSAYCTGGNDEPYLMVKLEDGNFTNSMLFPSLDAAWFAMRDTAAQYATVDEHEFESLNDENNGIEPSSTLKNWICAWAADPQNEKKCKWGIIPVSQIKSIDF